MKNHSIKIILAIFLCLSLNFGAFGQVATDSTSNFYKIKQKAEEYFLKMNSSAIQKTKKQSIEDRDFDGEYAKYKRWEWYWRDRVLPDGSFPDFEKQNEVFIQNSKSMKSKSVTENYQWSCINQESCQGGYNGMGRTTSIAFHPTDPNTFYVGAPIGGIWKTTDGGKTYTSLGDKLPYIGVGCIAIDYKNPNNIYISISDNGGWWNYSLGVYKSTDAGLTWNKTGLSWPFTNGIAIYAMEINPVDPNILFVASGQGLYRTLNSGVNWTLTKAGSCYDVKFVPGSKRTIYASFDNTSGIRQVYRTDNLGSSWAQKSNFTFTNNAIRLAVTPADTNMIAVLNTSNKEIYVSKNKGNSFTLKSTGNETSVLYISPFHPDTLYHGYMVVSQSKDGGSTWNNITQWYGGTALPEVHADHHFVKYNPLNNLIYFCCDGGLYSYNEQTNTWKEHSNGLVITQFYRLAVAQTDPIMVIGGSQDNGGLKRNSDASWSPTNGGDGMEVAIDPTNHNIFYTTYCDGVLYRTLDGWKTSSTISSNIPAAPKGEWVTPYVLEPKNSTNIIAGYSKVFRSTNRGTTWTAISPDLAGSATTTLQCVAVAPSNNKVIYATRELKLYVTKNLGTTWTTYNAPFSTNRITSIAVHPHNPDSIWITASGYTAGAKAYLSTNAGATWQNISGVLPNVPASIIVCDTTKTNNALYVGTDAGVYYKDDAQAWTYFGTGLPNTAVTDIDFQYNTKKIKIATFGRGMWETTMNGNVVNAYPQVSITSPKVDITVSGGQSVSISADASDADGKIQKVIFFNKSVKVGEVSTQPYTLNLLSIQAGDYSLVARAVDDQGNVTNSTPVNFTVNCPSTGRITGAIIGTNGSYNNLGNTKLKVFDGDITTFFDSSVGDNSYAGIDAGSATSIQGIRFYPRTGSESRMVGGYFQGSNSAAFTTDSEVLYTILSAPKAEWTCINVGTTKKYRYIRYVSPVGGWGNIAEMEAYTGIFSTGFNPISNKEMRIFPNPFIDTFTIETISDNALLTLSSIDGKIIPCKIQNTTNGTSISPSVKCTSGIYFLSVQEGNNVMLFKIMKQ